MSDTSIAPQPMVKDSKYWTLSDADLKGSELYICSDVLIMYDISIICNFDVGREAHSSYSSTLYAVPSQLCTLGTGKKEHHRY